MASRTAGWLQRSAAYRRSALCEDGAGAVRGPRRWKPNNIYKECVVSATAVIELIGNKVPDSRYRAGIQGRLGSAPV